MSLSPGTRLGSYEVISLLGAGGMGTVYKARDSKLGRDVALKVLPDKFTLDADRLARFKREAQVLASLNHPNIAIIHGLEESEGVRALVLEFVEGPTLADRIAEGAIPLEDALPIARQIAEALEAAHEQGIIHRDLKPANIKLRPDGAVKVLDFGLAKVLDSDPNRTDASQSPTITSPAMTGMGVILGTAAYMSPEQAKGRTADKRSDVWAFGCVLYEMLSGRRPFVGEDVSDTLAAVLRGEPDLSALPVDAPPAVVILIKRCLQKDRRERIAGISAASFVLCEPNLVTPRKDAPDSPAPRFATRYPKVTAAALLLIGAATSALLSRIANRPPAVPPQPVARFAVTLAPNQRFAPINRRIVALSPNGIHLAYVADGRLYLRALGRLDATPIDAVEGSGPNAPRSPFFSPDGEWIGFWQSGSLKRVSIRGGTPVPICEAEVVSGASWGDNDTIVFAQSHGLWRVPGAGGKAELFVKVRPGESAQGPELLPGGRAVLFTLRTDNSGSTQEAPLRAPGLGLAAEDSTWDEAQIVVQSLDTGDRQVLVEGGTDGRLVPSGHLVFTSRGTLFAVPFDATALKVTGGRVPVVENVAQTGAGEAHLTFSRNGVLAYVPGSFMAPLRKLAWVDRHGLETPINAPARNYMYPRVSPDGSRVAVTIFDRQEDIWIWDLKGERFTRLTLDPADDRYSEWTPDGRFIVFASRRGGNTALWRQPADGGAAERLAALPDKPGDWLVPSPVSLDNTRLVATWLPFGVVGGTDLFLLTLDSQRLEPLLRTPFAERSAELSPDGRWFVYQSNESGQSEIYARRTADVNSGRWIVSSGGGQHALWARNGRELFYAAPRGGLMHIAVESGTEWKAGAPTKLLEGPYIWTIPNFGGRLYDVSPDGQRFLVLKQVETPEPSTIVVVQNWPEELKQRVPTH